LGQHDLVELGQLHVPLPARRDHWHVSGSGVSLAVVGEPRPDTARQHHVHRRRGSRRFQAVRQPRPDARRLPLDQRHSQREQL
jgi:hypothetical protein